MKEIAIKRTWPGKSEKYVTVFANGSTKISTRSAAENAEEAEKIPSFQSVVVAMPLFGFSVVAAGDSSKGVPAAEPSAVLFARSSGPAQRQVTALPASFSPARSFSLRRRPRDGLRGREELLRFPGGDIQFPQER